MTVTRSQEPLHANKKCIIAGWGAVVGAHRVTSEGLEHEFNLPNGKISKGAGIESVARVCEGEDEVTLGQSAAEAALSEAEIDIGHVDCLIATSETHTGFPSLAARLHARMLADERCAAFDVGGGCLGLLYALAMAKAFLGVGQFHDILIVTADVHSRMLTPKNVKGEFGALFGDGASAFLLRGGVQDKSNAYHVGDVTLGCNAAAAAAIQVGLNTGGGLDLVFEGEALSRAALSRLEEMIENLELKTGIKRAQVSAFATHQPNPRLIKTLARQLKVPVEKFPPVALTCGNLGSSTCAVALVRAIENAIAEGKREPIFVASLGPGLLFGSTVLS
ncbi:MAG: hypothetical protein HY046_12280 [Acidobacteria bacterium]|nr:hypothetical protein [Acidobacteriota bacterium]